MNLIWLLLGPGQTQQSLRLLTVFGLMLVLSGWLIFQDTSGLITEAVMDVFGYTMVAFGLFRLALAIVGAQKGMPASFASQGILYLVLGMAVADFPDTSSQAAPWLLGVVLVVNGLYQLLSALIIRYLHWLLFVFSGLLQILGCALLLWHWRLVMPYVIPVLTGGGLILLGFSALRLAQRLLKTAKASDLSLPNRIRYYMEFHLFKRFHRTDYPHLEFPPEVGTPHGDLLVHIWTPTDVARLMNPDPNLINRYILAQDESGKVTVGHAAMEMSPDLYISHCDGDPTAYDNTEQALAELRSRDVSGVFLPSFQEEIEHYLQPSVTLRFRNFREDQLRAFWAMYRQVTDYNLTNRNCSVAVALALEVALMGSMAGSSRWKSFFSLLFSREVWTAHFLRWKAREMIWTPGLILDYTVALHRIVEG